MHHLFYNTHAFNLTNINASIIIKSSETIVGIEIMTTSKYDDELTSFSEKDQLDPNKEYQLINGEYVEVITIDYSEFLKTLQGE